MATMRKDSVLVASARLFRCCSSLVSNFFVAFKQASRDPCQRIRAMCQAHFSERESKRQTNISPLPEVTNTEMESKNACKETQEKEKRLSKTSSEVAAVREVVRLLKERRSSERRSERALRLSEKKVGAALPKFCRIGTRSAAPI